MQRKLTFILAAVLKAAAGFRLEAFARENSRFDGNKVLSRYADIGDCRFPDSRRKYSGWDPQVFNKAVLDFPAARLATSVPDQQSVSKPTQNKIFSGHDDRMAFPEPGIIPAIWGRRRIIRSDKI